MRGARFQVSWELWKLDCGLRGASGFPIENGWHGEVACAGGMEAVCDLQQTWSATGADKRRGWVESQACVFGHTPNGWPQAVTIVARRWRGEDDLPHMWHYSFIGTNFERGDLPRSAVRKYGFAPLLWMIYNTKQGHENHYKTPLSDFGLHHPPSGRLGVDEAFYAIAFVAVNVAMVIRHAVVPAPERLDRSGIRASKNFGRFGSSIERDLERGNLP